MGSKSEREEYRREQSAHYGTWTNVGQTNVGQDKRRTGTNVGQDKRGTRQT